MAGDEYTVRSSSVHDQPVGTMGRRRFVDTLLSVGFGALSASLLTAEDVAAAGRDEVPVVYGLTREDGEFRPRRKTVPADWYDDFRSAVAAHRNLDAIHRDGVTSSAVAPGEYGGRNAAIHVAVTDEYARGEVPERVEDTPVEVRNVEESGERGGADSGERGSGKERGSDKERGSGDSAQRNEDGSDSPLSVGGDDSPVTPDGGIPGSVKVASDDLYGTLAPAMTDPADGSRFFATSNHIYDGTGNGDEPLYLLDDDRTQIGSVQSGYPESDLVAVQPNGNFHPLHRIHEGEPGRVLGQFTKEGLADLKAEGEPLEKIGVKTGRTSGGIQAIDGLTCAYGAICKHGQLKWGNESGFSDGDSGSVNFHPDPENPDDGVLVGGINNARTWWPGENYIWGTAAYHITERHGYTF